MNENGTISNLKKKYFLSSQQFSSTDKKIFIASESHKSIPRLISESAEKDQKIIQRQIAIVKGLIPESDRQTIIDEIVERMADCLNIDDSRIEFLDSKNWKGNTCIGFYIDGLCHGYAQKFYKNSQMRTEGIYYFGKLHGSNIQTYFENGSKKYFGEMRFGYPQGKGTIYREDGSKAYEGYFNKGKQEGFGKEFNEKSHQIFRGSFYQGSREGYGYELYESGDISLKGNFSKGISNDEKVEYYYQSGELMYIGSYVDGLLNCKSMKIYWENGQLKLISNFINGQAVGYYRSYYKNGKLKMKGKQSEDGIGVFNLGISYWDSGVMSSIGNIIDNKKNGSHKSFYANGALMEDVVYVKFQRNDKNGHFYYPNGSLAYVGPFKDDKKHGVGVRFETDGMWKVMSYLDGNEVPFLNSFKGICVLCKCEVCLFQRKDEKCLSNFSCLN